MLFGRIRCILETFVDQIETNFASKESEELSQHNAWKSVQKKNLIFFKTVVEDRQ